MAVSVNDRNQDLLGATLRVNSASAVVTSNTANLTIDTGATVTTPGSLTLTCTTSGYISPTYQWYQTIGSGTETTISGATNSTLVITGNSTFITAMGTSTTIKYRVSVSETGRNTSTGYKDIPVLRNGDNAISGMLTNESVSLSAAADGTGFIVANAGGTFKVYKGTTDVTTSSTFSISGTNPQAGMTLAIGASTGIYSLSGATWTSPDTLSFTLNAIYNGTTISKVLTITRVKTGATGATGTAGATGNTAVFAYRVINSSSLPSAPSTASGFAALNAPYTTPTTSPVSDDGKWYRDPPGALSADLWCFQASGTKDVAGNYTWQSPSYLATFKVGKLAALAANLGSVEIDSTGALYSTGSSYLGTTPGYYFGYTGGYHKFSIGDGVSHLGWNGYSIEFQGYTLYGNYSLGSSNILAVTRVLNTFVPIVYIRDKQTVSISATNASTDVITLAVTEATRHFAASPSTPLVSANTPIKFNFSGGGITSGTTYYVKTIVDDRNFTISTSPGGSQLNITSSLTSPGNLTFVVSLTTKLMEINGSNTGAALDVINTNDAGGALGAYGYTSGAVASAVVLGQGGTAINLVLGGIKFNPVFTNTADANTLDDYEEGTWTPNVVSVTGITWGTKLGTYTKVGNLVTFCIYLPVSSVSSPSGDLTIDNLPFIVKNNGSQLTAYSVYAQNLNTSWAGNAGGGAWGSIQASSTPNSTVVYVRRVYQGNEVLDLGQACKATSTITISGSYLT